MDERLKMLNKTLGDIEKKHGKGSAMLMGDAPVEDIEAISTGSYMLNEALGIGGIPKGRIIEIYGPESSGKCLTEDTSILTPTGYKTIKEIFNENGFNTDAVIRTVEVKYPLINKDGHIEETTHFTFNGKKSVYKIVTKTGINIKGTQNHPLCVLNEEGYIVWKYSSEIKKGDILVGRKGDRYFSDKALINESEAFKIGDELSKTDDINVKVPLVVRNSNEEIQKSFIKGFFNNRLNNVSKSYILLKEVQLMLRNMGLISTLEKAEDNYILSPDLQYIKLFNSKDSLDISDDLLEVYTDEGLYFDKVVDVEKIENVPTFDFAMERTHTFIAEGIINHNTTLALHCVAECQKQNAIAAFIDAEHALDPIYAGNLGVNVDNLVLSQPDTGEQALDIVESLARSGVVDLIIVDSVAALVPKAEIDGEMGDSHMGLQARLMSQALRKIAGVVYKTNTTVIFINQVRENIGVMWGPKETTPGGRALKFYSSVRLDIRRIGAVKDGDNIIGNETRVKVVKNKVAPPFKQAEFTIVYGEGIDSTSELIDLAVEKGIINKGGSWYTILLDNGEEVKVQGAVKVKEALLANEDMYNEIKNKLFNKTEETEEKEED